MGMLQCTGLGWFGALGSDGRPLSLMLDTVLGCSCPALRGFSPFVPVLVQVNVAVVQYQSSSVPVFLEAPDILPARGVLKPFKNQAANSPIQFRLVICPAGGLACSTGSQTPPAFVLPQPLAALCGGLF